MLDEFSRTRLMLGKEAVTRLEQAKVAVFGVGGVGSFTCEALARAGVGKLVLVDDDVVCLTNINRQLIALHSTIGKPKVEVMKARILDINPKAEVTAIKQFYLPDNAAEMINADSGYDYIVDAVDTVTAKIDIVVRASEFGIPVISCMGAGNKLDPMRFEVKDIFATSTDPLAKVMRKELRARGVNSLKVVFSEEQPISAANGRSETEEAEREITRRRNIPGSISFVPSVAGLIIAGEVIKDIAGVSVKKG